MELSKRFGMIESRAKAILDLFLERQLQVEDLVERSFLSSEAKVDYQRRFADRLQALSQ